MRALAIGRAGQRDLVGSPETKVGHFDRVADRVDVRVARQQMIVDANSAPRPNVEPRIDRQVILRTDADADDHQLRRQLPP